MTGWENRMVYLAVPVVCFMFFIVSLIFVIISCIKKKPRRKSLFMLVASILLAAGCTAFMISHPTYYKYNDNWIMRHSSREIQERYGEYDVHKSGMSGYYIYTDTDGIMPDHLPHYYYIYFDIEGRVVRVEDSCQTGG